MINGGLAAIVTVLGFTAVWLCFILRKLKRLENKEFLDRVYQNAEKDIAGQSLDELVRDSNERANRGNPRSDS